MPFAASSSGQTTEPTHLPFLHRTSFIYSDVLSKVAGRHGLKFGVSAGFNQTTTTMSLGPQGLSMWPMDCGTSSTALQSSKVLTSTPDGLPTDVHKYYRQHDFGFFVQDDFKVRPNLTFNIACGMTILHLSTRNSGRRATSPWDSGPDPLATASLRIGRATLPCRQEKLCTAPGFAWTPSDHKQVG